MIVLKCCWIYIIVVFQYSISNTDSLVLSPRTCPDISFYNNNPCPDGSGCFSDAKKCDGHNDCLDGSDEIVDMCRNHTCAHEFTKCHDGVQCIFEGFMCNMKGWNDCKDASDEDAGYCKDYTCTDGHTKCADGIQCIPINYKCNARPGDCNDLSDDANCTAYTCPMGYTKCRDGKQCIYEHFMCDNDRQHLTFCDDGSDEDSNYCAERTNQTTRHQMYNA